jgi:hypothetical protein
VQRLRIHKLRLDEEGRHILQRLRCRAQQMTWVFGKQSRDGRCSMDMDTDARGPTIAQQQRRCNVAGIQQLLRLHPLTLRMRNTLRAAANDAMILRASPGCPAAMNMQAYCSVSQQ